MGVTSGCGKQEAGVASGSGWNLLVWLVGVVVRRYIDFLLLYPFLFCSSMHPYFLFIFKCFSFLLKFFFVKKIYVLKFK